MSCRSGSYVCMYTYVCLCTYVCMYVCRYVIRIYVCMCIICIHAHYYTHTHTHTHTWIWSAAHRRRKNVVEFFDERVGRSSQFLYSKRQSITREQVSQLQGFLNRNGFSTTTVSAGSAPTIECAQNRGISPCPSTGLGRVAGTHTRDTHTPQHTWRAHTHKHTTDKCTHS